MAGIESRMARADMEGAQITAKLPKESARRYPDVGDGVPIGAGRVEIEMRRVPTAEDSVAALFEQRRRFWTSIKNYKLSAVNVVNSHVVPERGPVQRELRGWSRRLSEKRLNATDGI